MGLEEIPEGIFIELTLLIMAIVLKVTWVDKSDSPKPDYLIRHIGGDTGSFRWKHTPAQAIEFIERGHFTYYVEKDARAWRLYVGRTSDGGKDLKVETDGGFSQLLLDLPPMPPPVPFLSPPG